VSDPSGRRRREPQPPQKQGCMSGCATGCAVGVVGLIALGAIGGIIGLATQKGTPEKKPEKSATSETWTKTHTPEWTQKLDLKVRGSFAALLNDDEPLYTAFYCDGKSTKVYVDRARWAELTRLQASNNLQFSVLLPHTNKTVIEYIDDKSGEKLATFTPKQRADSITIIHP
jgi:hypothetical protein